MKVAPMLEAASIAAKPSLAVKNASGGKAI
jgi:hypothetical protein